MIIDVVRQILSQCESQVQKLPSFAFALAQVVVNVASQVCVVLLVSLLLSFIYSNMVSVQLNRPTK
jgi:hypothetical protein